MSKKSYLTIALLCASTNVMASGYVGAAFGTVDMGLDSISSFDDPTGFELFLGTRVNQNLSIEAALIGFGEASDGIAPVWRVNSSTLAFGALAIAPVNENFDVFMKVGLHLWNAEISQDGYGVFAEDDGTDFFYGVGATMKVNQNLSLGARYNSYDMDGDDVTMFSLNAQIGF